MKKAEMFIDGANLSHQLMRLNQRNLDYSEVKDFLRKHCDLIRINFYTAIVTEDNGEVKLQPILDWMQYNGINVISKPARTHQRGDTTVIKGNMDIEITLGIVSACAYVDEIILLSGDGDFVPALEYAKQRGIRTTVFSSKESGATSDDLVRSCDTFIDLENLIELRNN